MNTHVHYIIEPVNILLTHTHVHSVYICIHNNIICIVLYTYIYNAYVLYIHTCIILYIHTQTVCTHTYYAYFLYTYVYACTGKFNVSLSISGGGLSTTVCINGSVTIDCSHSETMVHPVWSTNRIRYILNNRMEKFNKISHSAHLHSLRIGPVPNNRGWNGSTYTCQYWRGVTVYQSNEVTLFIKGST